MRSSAFKIKLAIIGIMLMLLVQIPGAGKQAANQFIFTSSYSMFSSAVFFQSFLFFNSPLWILFGLQNSSEGNSEPDSLDGTPSIFNKDNIYRFSGKHPKSGPNYKYKSDKFFDETYVDSTAGSVSTKILLDSILVGYTYDIDIDDYLGIRKKQLQNKIWDSLLARYDLREALTGGDLARLISQSTGLTIPVPPNPVLGLFGKPQININVSGEVNLKVGWRWDSQNLGTVSAFGQTQSTPIFSQDIRVNVSASIGDKLKLKTDWNTRRQFEFDNKFKIGYEGEDDEIIKLIEVGNVSLPVPTSLIGGGEALFGVRSDYQFGPLYLKTIFSQRRGERKFINVRGGVSTMPFEIRAYDFAKNHFFLDTVYKPIYQEYFKHSTPIQPSSDSAKFYRVKEIEVWESTSDIKQGAVSAVGVAYSDLSRIQTKKGDKYPASMKFTPIEAGKVERGNFLKLDSNRYNFDFNLGTLHILNLRPERFYAVSYRVEGGPEETGPDNDWYYGTFSTQVAEKDTLILKLIYRPNMQPGFKSLWERQMKNIYSMNASLIDVSNTKIGMWYINQNNDSSDVLPGAPDKLVTIFGVDQVTNSTGSAPPDGQFDLREPFFDPNYGEIIFPNLQPFDSGLVDYFTKIGTPELAGQYTYSEIYDTTYDIARRNTARDRFIITGEVSGKATNRINLGAFNLAPNSVKVTLDGVPLREFEDYVIDYYAGQLTLRNPRASLPNANLKIEYEARDIFNISTRTLAGIRGDYQLMKTRKMDTKLGFTLMHYDQSALIDRVRLGEEPVANTMLGLDANLNWDTPWLTKALDFLPFYDTKAKSSMQIRGEWAMTLPQPNKRTSEVASDNNEPVVYIDDFEGAQRYIPLGLTASQWSQSSQPVDSLLWENDPMAASYRAKSFWYQYFIPKVKIKEVYPNKDVPSGRSNLSPLYINFDADMRGIYNNNPQFLDSVNLKFNPDADLSYTKDPNNREKIWGGMMRLFSSFNTNFDTENIDYIEIMMKIEQWDLNTKMFIDIGQISEDIIPNQTINTEDGITDANPVPNNIIDPGEDLGIDAHNNIKEKDEANYSYPLNLEDDPARDDYAFNFGKDDNDRNENDFKKYNNFEGNSLVSEIGQFPDTEILNPNNGQTLSLDNSYFEYEVKLDPRPEKNPQIVGGNPDAGWFLYRIPIRKPNKKVGNPLFSNIQYIRVWFRGGDFKAMIADWRLVGSQWQRISNFQSNVADDDSAMQISFVNREENSAPPDYYKMPPGVKAPRQLNNPDPTQDLRLNEQSISVSVKNLRYGDERMAVRIFRPLDIFFYKKLKFFIHGDGSMPDNLVGGSIPKAFAFLRFGTDSSNYYEYRRPLTRDWQDVEIKLSELTAIKQLRDSLYIRDRMIYPVPNDPLAYFAVKGNPVLTRVQFFGLGIANPAERYPNELSTTMWVDELRLLNPEDRSDWAGIANASIKLADLGSINASFSHTKPNFHRLEERFGNRINSTNWTVAMQGNLDRFAPKSFSGMKVPISYTHAEILQDPEFVANNDINLSKAAEAARVQAYDQALRNGLTQAQAQQIATAREQETISRSQTVKVSDSWALTGIKLGIPVKHWLIDDTFNKLTFGYSYSQDFERSPVVEQRFNWIWKLNTQYSVQISDFLAFQPFDGLDSVFLIDNYSKWKLNFLPSNFSAGLDMQRSRTTEKSRFLDFASPVFRDFSANRSVQFSWKLSENGLISPTIDYNFHTGSTLVPYELDESGRQRTGSELANQVLFNNGIVDLGTDNVHTQNISLNFKPNLPIGSVRKYFDITGSYSSNYTWRDPLQPDPAIRDVAKNASVNTNLRFSTGFRLKELADSWYGASSGSLIKMSTPVDSTSLINTTGIIRDILLVFKTIFLDYDKIQMDITQANTSLNPGVFGGSGISNFWGRGITGRESLDHFGPSFAYQLGLVGSPHGSFGFAPSGSFPFFSFETDDGLRPPNAILPENYNQKTTLKLSTTRPLWDGAVLELNWNSDVSYNRTRTVETDAFGNPSYTNVMATESFNRSYLSIPAIFGWDVFNNDIDHVIELYEEKRKIIAGGDTTLTPEQNQALLNALGESFHDGLQSFSLFSGTIGKFLPAINWAIRWEGIENWGIWGGLVKTANIEHRYTSNYTENALINDNGRTIQNQQVQIGFQPLFGLTMSFDEKQLNGVLTATMRLSTTTGFQLSSANRSTIARNSTTELQAQASYTMRGFEWNFLGLKLQNDLEASFMATYQSSDRSTYDVVLTESNGDEGRKLDGNSKIIIEPRVRYSMSNRVTAAFFVRYEGTFTEGAAQPGFNTTQVGLDIRISIAGGR
ncbi:cell surface protein SprA [Bacteroidota bacterium]